MLRDYQEDLKRKICTEWDRGVKNVLAVLPTGAGKTVLFSNIIRENKTATCAIAHRQELVTQISTALAREGVRHRIIGPNNVVKLAVSIHMQEFNRSYYDPSAQCAVAGVDTIIRRGSQLSDWLRSVSLWVMDEAHHVLRSNKWGKAVVMFPDAKGLGVTATPLRADGKGLGAEHDGYFQSLLVGTHMRELIHRGYLSDYRIFAPHSNINLAGVGISSATGDYSKNQLVKAVQKSRIVGDVVDHYARIARGKLGITFATDVQTANNIADKFNASGIPAACVSANTPDRDRISVLRKLAKREILQVVNVDLFGEGFDLPAIEVGSMARPTASYGLFVQQFGRALRPLPGKDRAIIIDHVDNVIRHGLPDAWREWSLARREKRSSESSVSGIPVKVCAACTGVYLRIYPHCPFCGAKPEPGGRSLPEQVDGDLLELDPVALARMRGAVDKIDMHPEAFRMDLIRRHVPKIGRLAGVKRHVNNQEAQKALRQVIAWWAGFQRSLKRPDSESYRRFFFNFGIDVLSAQALKASDALSLAERITKECFL